MTAISIPAPDWVISDTHFGHAAILTYCPWRRSVLGSSSSIELHDKTLLLAWTERVQAHHTVLHLGDFALVDQDKLAQLRRSCSGKIVLVRGNHDRTRIRMLAAGFDVVASEVTIETYDGPILCRHDPSSFTPAHAHRAALLLHGHTHGQRLAAEVNDEVRERAVDCSVDALRLWGPMAWIDLLARASAAGRWRCTRDSNPASTIDAPASQTPANAEPSAFGKMPSRRSRDGR